MDMKNIKLKEGRWNRLSGNGHWNEFGCSEVEFLSVYILFIYIHFANLFIFFHYLKQPDMFHKYYLNGYACDGDDDAAADDVDHNNDDNGLVGPIIAAIQKQQAKKTARLPKNNISDSLRVIVHNSIELAGRPANPAKRIVTLLSNEMKYDPKILSNVTELLQTNRMKAIAFMFEATIDCYQRGIKPDKQNQKCLQSLDKVFKIFFITTLDQH